MLIDKVIGLGMELAAQCKYSANYLPDTRVKIEIGTKRSLKAPHSTRSLRVCVSNVFVRYNPESERYTALSK